MTKSRLVHYVELFYPKETSIKEIKNRKSKFEIPKECFGYRFFDEKEGNFSLSNTFGPINFSKNIYFGELMELKDQKIVKTKFGRYIFLNSKDKVISYL